MDSLKDAISLVESECQKYWYGYNQNGMLEKWENVLKHLKELQTIKEAARILLGNTEKGEEDQK